MARFTTVKLRDKEYEVYVTKLTLSYCEWDWCEGGSEAYNALNITGDEECSIVEQIINNLWDDWFYQYND